MSDRKVYLLTEDEVTMLRQAGMFTQPQPTFIQSLAQDVRCATCRWWQDGWQCLPSEEVQLTAEATGGDYSTALSTDPNHACSMWEPQP